MYIDISALNTCNGRWTSPLTIHHHRQHGLYTVTMVTESLVRGLSVIVEGGK